nr:immunoglobulin light chain junction region [Macaca mulatta]MOX78099.1 immunoglobulin light chain junction region [Macaca mulatta]MOX79142.1 immunoglobulin light chain junction region [Macaca mulatta]MOX80402.1 immunoglobulin light chain junction region [Macaca mulatta]MOX84286.1 immunoglobulin light chain junction region [Macaca mulatta]
DYYCGAWDISLSGLLF